MEEPHIPVNVNYLSCRICRNLLRNPATIPCGHNFCLDCIEGCWDGEQTSNLSCPECGQRFPSRPSLIRNTTLAQMIGDMERSRKRKEEASADTPPKRGRSNGDTSGSALCWRHGSPLDVYCSTDGKIICAECALDKHNGHVVGLVNEERRRKQEELRVVQTKLKETLQEQQKQQENLKRMFDQTEREADKTKDDCETAIVRVIDGLQRHYLCVRKLIEAQVEAAEAQISASLQTLETKIAEMKKMCSELDLLAESDNSVLFLQEWPSMQSVCETDLLLSFTEAPEDPLLPIEVTKRAIDQLGRQLEDFCDQQFASIAQTCNVDQDESVRERGVEDQQQRRESSVGFTEGNMSKKIEEPITRDDFLQYACDLSLDPTTAHKDLIISPGDKEVKLSDIRCQPWALRQSERFTHRHQVLCREGLQAERCYYEVEVKGDKAEIALAYKGMDRKSSTSKSGFGANAKSWSLDRNNFYSVSHKSESIQLTQRPSGEKIGVYLKFKEGTLSFYEVSDSMRFLYKLESEFTEPLYPGFWLDDKCCIRICDLKQRQQ